MTFAPVTVVPPRLRTALVSIFRTRLEAANEGIFTVTITEPAATFSRMLIWWMPVALAIDFLIVWSLVIVKSSNAPAIVSCTVDDEDKLIFADSLAALSSITSWSSFRSFSNSRNLRLILSEMGTFSVVGAPVAHVGNADGTNEGTLVGRADGAVVG